MILLRPDDGVVLIAEQQRVELLEVLVEGVESVEQVAFLRENSCQLIQGYLVGRPFDCEQTEKWIASSLRALQSIARENESNAEPRGAAPSSQQKLVARTA